MTTPWEPGVLERMVRAVHAVRERLLRATAALDEAGVPYAVVGGHAVATWVAQIEQGATRNTPDVNILLRRADLETAASYLEMAGFLKDERDRGRFLDGRGGRPR